MSTASQTSTHDADDEVVREPSTFEGTLEELRDLRSVFFRTLYYTVKGRREKGDVAKQMFAIGNESLFFMVITLAFVGAIISFQAGMQMKRLIPDTSLLGTTFMKLLIRDLGPSVGAMPLATRVGAGIAAEIGSMVVTDQTDALRMCAADPVDYLVVPRFIASTIMGTVLLIVGSFAAFIAGLAVAMVVYDVNLFTFLNFPTVKWTDCVLGLLKCTAYGGCIAIISAQRGLRTFGGSEGVGIATTDAVVGSLFSVIVLQFILSAIGFVLLPA